MYPDELLWEEICLSEDLTDCKQSLIDMYETDEKVIVTVQLPGVGKEDILINTTPDGAEIRVETMQEEVREQDGKQYVKRSSCGFYTKLMIPSTFDKGNMHAHFEHSVLELQIPKTSQIQVR